MQSKTVPSPVALIAACIGAGLAACASAITTVDGGADVPVVNDVRDASRNDFDVAPNDVADVSVADAQDVAAGDVQDVPVVDVQDVRAADVQDDEASVIDFCPTNLPDTATLLSFTQSVNDTSVWLLAADWSMLSNPDISPFAPIHSTASSPPEHVATTADSTCFYFATLDGSTARENSPIEDRGMLTIQQARFPITATFDSVMGKYVFDLSMAFDLTGQPGWMPGMPVTATLAGGAGGSGGTSAPLPLYPLIHSADFTFPSPISRSSDNTFTWSTPAGLPADQVAMAVIFNNSDFSDAVYCFAAACQHRMTVPASIMMYTQANAPRLVVLVFPVVAPIGSGTDAVNFLLLSGVDNPGFTGP